MSLCASCEDTGFVPFVFDSLGKSDADVTVDDMQFGLCLCDYGLRLRSGRNHTRKVAPFWMIWAAQHQVSHDRIHRVEDVFSADELAAAGFSKGQPASTAERLLAAGRRRSR